MSMVSADRLRAACIKTKLSESELLRRAWNAYSLPVKCAQCDGAGVILGSKGRWVDCICQEGQG